MVASSALIVATLAHEYAHAWMQREGKGGGHTAEFRRREVKYQDEAFCHFFPAPTAKKRLRTEADDARPDKKKGKGKAAPSRMTFARDDNSDDADEN